jgi:excinuclease ABC subunit B
VPEFKTTSAYTPTGDQPGAIETLARSIGGGERYQTLLGATGTGKTATMAWIIEQIQRPTLVIAHNKTLAAQLCNEFREFFPDNAVEYFVSYYDYYQPEAYVPQADLYIEKDSSRNDDIDRLRHAATSSLMTRRDVIIVASVSCIYGLGSPEEYKDRLVFLEVGQETDRDQMLRKLIDIQYVRNDTILGRGKFRVKGDVVEIQPAYSESAYRVSMFGDEVEQITHFDPLTGEIYARHDTLTVFPATQYVTSKPTLERAIEVIRDELEEQVKMFESQGRMLEAHRIRQRTEYDMEMMAELGFCNGIENYSRPIEGRPPGSPPFTLLDYFPSDYVVFVDESHQTVPQIGGMYEGDRSRKQTLVDFGFRLPSALDNRPLRFDEFLARVPQLLFVSATPGAYELRHSSVVAEQLIRPTGLVDPEVELRETKNQIDDLLNEIRRREEVGERVLVTTLTKKMAEDLTDYLLESGVKARYLHSEIDTLERIQIIRELRLGEYDVLVGVNLLREGLDLPEVSLVAILDADKEDGADPDDRPRSAARERQGADVRRQADRGDQGRARRDDPAPSEAARLQRGARDHAGVDRQGRVRHRGAARARVAARPVVVAPAGRAQGRGPRPRRARAARRRPGARDVRRRGGAAIRVRGQAPRRDQGAAARAERAGRGLGPVAERLLVHGRACARVPPPRVGSRSRRPRRRRHCERTYVSAPIRRRFCALAGVNADLSGAGPLPIVRALWRSGPISSRTLAVRPPLTTHSRGCSRSRTKRTRCSCAGPTARCRSRTPTGGSLCVGSASSRRLCAWRPRPAATCSTTSFFGRTSRLGRGATFLSHDSRSPAARRTARR